MNNLSAWSLKFRKEELYLVAGMLQSGNLIGFEDPFLGQLADTVEKDLDTARTSLQARRYLLQQPNGELILDSSVAAMVRAITTSENILIAVNTLGGETSYWFYHFTTDLLLEQLELPNGDIILAAIQNTHELYERMRMLFALKESSFMKEFPSFTLTKHALWKARQIAREEPEMGTEALVLAGVPKEAVTSMLSSLQEGKFIDSLIVLRRAEIGMVYGKTLNWLFGSTGIWLVNITESGDQTIFEMSPTTYSKLQNKLGRLAEPLLSQAE